MRRNALRTVLGLVVVACAAGGIAVLGAGVLVPAGGVAALASGAIAPPGAADGASDLERARTEFERHNYRAALETVDRLLATEPPADAAGEARLIRGQCLLKLRRWEEGVKELEALLAADEEIARRPDVHEALGQVGLEQFELRHLAIVHFGTAANLHLEASDKQAAAAALINKAEGYVGFDRWDLLPELKVPPPQDWRDSRRLQRKLAIAALDLAIELAGESDLAAEALFRKARLFQQDLRLEPEDTETALKLLARLVERWPTSKRAPEALYEMGQIHDSYKQDYVAAVEHYRRVMKEYAGSSWAPRAKRCLERIVAPQLQLAVEGPVRPGTPALIHYHCRNVKEVNLRAYRVDLFELIRQVDRLEKLAGWQPGGEPVATWTLSLPDEGTHQFINSGPDGPPPTTLPVEEPGAYLVIGGDAGGKVQAHTMILISSLACVVKSARSATLVVAADGESGRPVAGAEVLVQRYLGKNQYKYVTGATDDAGRYRLVTAERKDDGGTDGLMIVRDGPHYAVSNASFYWYWWGYGERYRAYCFTDRPVYRPDQVIHFKTIVRQYDRGTYETVPNQRVTMKVHDPRGQVIDERELVTGPEGSVSGDLHLPEGAALGLYRIESTSDGQRIDAGAGARFRVEEYRKPEFEVTVRADRADYRIGDTVEARIEARYYFGEPVADAKVKCTVYRARCYPYFPYPTRWPWFYEDLEAGGTRFAEAGPLSGRHRYPPGVPWQEQRDLVGTFEATTDEQGVAVIRLEAKPFDAAPEADLRYDVEAEVTDASRRVITGSGRIKVTHQPFYLNVRPQRYVCQPGDTVRMELEAKSPNDDPMAVRVLGQVYRLERKTVAVNDGQPADEYALGDRVFEQTVTIDDTGRGELKWTADEEGPFRVVAAAEPAGDTAVTTSCDLWVARQGGRFAHYAYRDLELVPDRLSYAVGDVANVLINTRLENCYVLLTAESDDLLDDRIVFVKGGTHLVELPITRAHVPNFELSATVLANDKVYQDRVPVIVPPADRFLNVAIDVPGNTFHPQQQIELGVKTTDAAGEPAVAEVALMIVDASIYYIQPEFRWAIEKHFYGRKRPALVQTHSSFDFGGGGLGPLRRDKKDFGDLRLAGDAPMALEAKAMAPAPGADQEEAAEFATAEIRKEFPDTVLWAAHVTTDAAGRASVNVTLPDTLTTWRVHAVAADRDTRVGQAASDVITRKDVIVRLETPRFLVERDRPVLTVIAHNYLDVAKKMQVTLETPAQIKLGQAVVGGSPAHESAPGRVLIEVPAGGEVAVDFPAEAVAVGEAVLTARAAADVDADAVQITLPVIPYGADRFVAQSGSIRQDDKTHDRGITFAIPEEVAAGTPLMEIHLNPSIAAVMIDALPYLLEYPYGCTEQTMSRFLPAVVVRRTLQKLGIDLAAIAERSQARGGPAGPALPARFRNNPVFNNALMDDMIRKGLQRLAELQRPDGGWGWWAEGLSDPYMTAYVVYGLTEALAADVPVDRGMLDRGAECLTKRVVSAEPADEYARARDDDNLRAWMLYALAMHDPAVLDRADVSKVLLRIYEEHDGLTDYSRAMLLIALHRAGDGERAGVVVENLYNTVRLDEELGTASWGDGGSYRFWHDNGLEATAMVLRALLTVQPEHDYVPKAVNWLVRNRRGSRWCNTKDTAFAVYALADYLVASRELQADMTINVTIDGRPQTPLKVTPENALTFDTRIVVGSDGLAPGEHRVELSRSGTGNLYYAVYLDYFTRQDPIEPAGHEVFVTRKYARLIPREVTKTRHVYDAAQGKQVEETYQAIEYDAVPLEEGDAVASGDLIEVALEIEAKNDFEYLIFEDPKPAGCEPVELHSGYHYGRGPCVATELRDQKTAFFATYLPQGKHPLSYRLRCETPGHFHALPARVEAMYSPYVRANSRSDKLEIGGNR